MPPNGLLPVMSFLLRPDNEKLVTTKGTFNVTGQTVAPLTTWILEIPLSKSTFKQGYMIMSLPLSAAVYTAKRRAVATIMFTTDEQDATSSSMRKVTYTIPSYPQGTLYFFDDWRQEGFRFDVDGQLSELDWAASSGQLMIQRCWIDSNTLKVEFRNTHGTITANVEIQGSYHAYE